MASDPGESYDAFISYSHAVDGKLAPALQRALQRFAKPWYRTRALRVFRDEASLSANPALWRSIEQALDNSSWFILLASPGSAASPWVAREVAHWRATKPVERILIALTEGDLAWGADNADFDWERTDAAPETLRGAFRGEPRFIDLRWAHASEHLSLSDGRFRDAVAELAAPLHGVPKDFLAGEEVRQHRRTVRIARAAGAALAGLTLSAMLFGVFALRQRSEAIAQRDLAVSRGLVQATATNLDSRIDIAALLSVEAFRINPSAETRSALVATVARSEHVGSLLHTGQPVESVTYSPDRTKLAAAGTRSVSVWNMEDSASLPLVVPVANAKAVAFDPDGESVAVAEPRAISIWSLEAAPRRVISLPLQGATALAYHGKDRIGAVGATEAVLFSESGEKLRRWAFVLGVSASVFAVDVPVAAVAGPHGVAVIDMRRDSRTGIATSEIPTAVAISADGTTVAAADRAGDDLAIWRPGHPRVRVQHLRQSVSALAFAPDGRLVLGGTNGTIELRPVSEKSPPVMLRGPAGSIYDIVFLSDAPLTTAGELGIVVRWNPDSTPTGRVLGRLTPTFGLDFAEDSNTLAVAGFGNALTVWQLDETPEARQSIRVSSDQQAVVVDAGGTSFLVVKPDGAVVLVDEDGPARQLASPRAASRPIAVGATGLVAWGGDGAVELWQLRTDVKVPPLDIPGEPTDLAFSGDGRSMAVAGTRGVELWDLDTRTATTVTKANASSVALGRSGALVAYAYAGGIVVWSADDANRRVTMAVDLSGPVSLAFTPDEQTLAVGTSSGRLRLMDTETGVVLGQPRELEGGPVVGVDFAPDGATLATATQGGVVAAWDDMLWSDADAMQRHVCGVAGRNLTEDEWREFVPGHRYHATCSSARP